MEIFENPAVIWFLIGFVLFLLEFLLPGLIVFFFGLGAWVVALTCLFTDLSFNSQLILFAVTSVLSVLLFRKWVKGILWSKMHSNEIIQDEFLGKTGKAETFIGPGRKGKVDFKGTSWDARSEDIIEAGENVIITGNDSIVLIVKSTKIIA